MLVSLSSFNMQELREFLPKIDDEPCLWMNQKTLYKTIQSTKFYPPVLVQIANQRFRVLEADGIADNVLLLTPKFYTSIRNLKDEEMTWIVERANRVGPAALPGAPAVLPSKKEKGTFRSFLAEAKIVGLPKGVEETLLPILAAFGPLKAVMEKRGLKTEKGLLLCGPPGTGKTMLANTIANYLESPQIEVVKVNATELIHSHVGESEAAIRALFEDKTTEWRIIIIDEVDAVALDRKNCEKSWERSKVAAFLSCMDGLKSDSKIVVIATTNSPDRMDKAFCRHKRFGVIIYFELPNQAQRVELFQVYLKDLIASDLIGSDVQINDLASLTEGCSGADIAGIVDSANRTAFHRVKQKYDEELVTESEMATDSDGKVTMQDFRDALEQIKIIPQSFLD